MDLESELKKLLGERIASNELIEPVQVEPVDAPEESESSYGQWTPAPWHREEWRKRDSRLAFRKAA